MKRKTFANLGCRRYNPVRYCCRQHIFHLEDLEPDHVQIQRNLHNMQSRWRT